MRHHKAGGIWKGRHGVGRVEGCEHSPFDVCPGRVMPVCLAHGSGDSTRLHNLLLERPGLKQGTPCGAQWMVAYLADSRLCSGPGSKRMAGSKEKGLGGREKVHMNLADTICYFLWNPIFCSPWCHHTHFFCHNTHFVKPTGWRSKINMSSMCSRNTPPYTQGFRLKVKVIFTSYDAIGCC